MTDANFVNGIASHGDLFKPIYCTTDCKAQVDGENVFRNVC